MNPTTVAIDARLIGGTSTGDSTYWTGLLHGFSKLSLPFQILLISDKPKPIGVPDVENIDWLTLPSSNSRLWSLVRFPLAARKRGAKAIHTQYTMSPLVGDRGITTIHDVSFLIGPQWFPARDAAILKQTVPAAIRRAAKVITVSETSRSEIERLIPIAKGKTVVTANACPPWIVAIGREEARKVVATQFGINSPYVLTLGTKWPRKNMQLATDAVELLPSDIPNQLMITGKAGWGELKVGKRAKALGYVDERYLSALYAAADLYLAPSRHEGFGIPVLEAFRCGCPVMASTGGALPEVVGDAGIVEGSWDAKAWSQTMEGLLRSPSKLDELREKGYVRERLFSWEIAARKTLAVYSEVAQ